MTVTLRNVKGVSIVLVGTIILWYVFVYEPSVTDPLLHLQERPYVVPHMGFGTDAPESSLEATRRALESGSRFIDIDVRLSQDGVPMVVHDPQIRDGVRRFVSEATAAQLEDVVIPSPNGYDGPTQYIRPLRDHLALIQSHDVFVTLEIKDWYGERASRSEREVLALLREFDLSRRTILVSAYPPALCRLNRYPDILNMYTFVDRSYYDVDTERLIRSGEVVGPAFYRLPYIFRFEPVRRAFRKVCRPDVIAAQRDVPLNILRTLSDAGYPLFMWDIHTRAEPEALLIVNPFALVVDSVETFEEGSKKKE